MTDTDFIIPVYLNQRTVFDMIAMLQDGISTVSKIVERNDLKENDSQNYGASFGLNQALSSLLKIDLQGNRETGYSQDSASERSEERVHTPSSLFQKLRSSLISKKALIPISKDSELQPGMMVEFSTTLVRNPLTQTLESFNSAIDIVIALTPKGGKGTGKSNSQNSDLHTVQKQIKSLLDITDSDQTIDIISSLPLVTGHKAVLTLEREYLNDPKMADLVDGQFKVVGKLTKVVETDEPQSINLLRKSPLASFNSEQLKQLFNALSSAATQGNMTVPETNFIIEAPVIQVLPIAIFT